MSSRRRRRTRSDAATDRMDAIREQADQPTPTEIAPIPDEEIDAEAQAQEDAADEIATGMVELGDEPIVDNTPVPDSVPAQPDAFTDSDPDDEYENFTEEWPNPVEQEPEFDPEIFERGPLAAGIRMLEALLTEARSGYITSQVEELERVLDISLDPGERLFLGQIAAGERTASGLPDVAGAYQALVSAKARAQA